MKKKMALLSVLAMSSLALVACQNDEQKEILKAESDILLTKLVENEKDGVVATVGKETITSEEVVKKINDEVLISYISSMVDNAIITDTFPATEDEIKEKAIALGWVYDEISEDEKEKIKFEISYLKGLASVYQVSEEEMKRVYAEYFKEDEVSYDEIKPNLEEIALRTYALELFDKKLKELRGKTEIKFEDEQLEKEYKNLQEVIF